MLTWGGEWDGLYSRSRFEFPQSITFVFHVSLYASISLERSTLFTIQVLFEALQMEYVSVECKTNMAAKCSTSNANLMNRNLKGGSENWCVKPSSRKLGNLVI